jgi:hypothetical protein
MYHRKKVLRTTLTNGRSWIFVIVCLNEGNNGASYRHSEEIKLDASPTSLMPDLISATLLSWESLLVHMVGRQLTTDSRFQKVFQISNPTNGFSR